MGIWSRTYVCCAVPLYNGGIYAIMSQFAIVSIVAGVLSFAAPDIVAVATPSWCSWIFGAVSILVGLTQFIGFFGVYRERPSLFRTYHLLNTSLVSLDLIVAVAFIALSAARHSTAVSTCEALFSSSTTNSTSKSVCNIWTWVQIGIMGLLWALVTICEVYFLMYAGIYASEQRLDHARYDSIYSSAAEEIRQSGMWDNSRPSIGREDSFQPPVANYATRQPSQLRHQVPRGGEEEEYYAQQQQQPGSAGLYADDASYYPQQHQQGGYAQDEYGYAGQHQGYAQGAYDEKGYVDQNEYAPPAQHYQQQQQPPRGGWDPSGYR